jgi:ATP-dependent Clp protease adapter protein ClpS
LTPLSENLGRESNAHGFRGCGTIADGAGILCYVVRRFQSKSLTGKDPGAERSDSLSELYEVRIIDNDYNTYQQVMDVSMLALAVSEDEAFAIAWEVDHEGFCVVAQGPYAEAEAIAKTIRTIGIEVQVNLMKARVN